MKLTPKYSYEFNCILNEEFNEEEQIRNFASLLSDKERFFLVISQLHENEELIKGALGYELPETLTFFVVRAEKFNSFSEPITVEYSIVPERMFLFLLKEILKTVIIERFPDEQKREEYVNAFISFLAQEGSWKYSNLEPQMKTLHEESKKLYKNYKEHTLDFKKKTMKEYLEALYEE